MSGIFLKTGQEYHRSPVRFHNSLYQKAPGRTPYSLTGPPHGVNGGNWVRKEQCNYGWDWGPCLLTCGIWRPIKLIACNIVQLKDVYVGQKHIKDGSVTLDITAELTAKPDGKS